MGKRNGETIVMNAMIIMTLPLFIDSSLWLPNDCSFEDMNNTQSVCIRMLPLQLIICCVIDETGESLSRGLNGFEIQ